MWWWVWKNPPMCGVKGKKFLKNPEDAGIEPTLLTLKATSLPLTKSSLDLWLGYRGTGLDPNLLWISGWDIEALDWI